MEGRFENFTISILKLNRLVQKIKVAEMKDYGLRAIHVMCVYCLDKHSEGLTIGELAKLTIEDKGAISRAVSLLQEKGYVSEERGYNARITLTTEGREVAKYIADRAECAVQTVGKDIDEKEREQFYRTLDSITHSLEHYFDTLDSAQ
jgi:DNA-binding MarR family transcriptional regulator